MFVQLFDLATAGRIGLALRLSLGINLFSLVVPCYSPANLSPLLSLLLSALVSKYLLHN